MRTQLPGYSPFSPAMVAKSLTSALSSRSDAHGELLRGFLRSTLQAEEAILLGSGTQALQTAIALARSARGAEDPGPVALPAYACFDLVSAAVGAHTPIVFYDLDPRTLAPDMESVRAALASRPFALVGANLFGFPLPWSELLEAVSGSSTVLIEDAAQGLGSTWGDRSGGSFGDLTVLSFARGKGWTGGGGGALLARGGMVGPLRDALKDFQEHRRGLGLNQAVGSGAQWLLGRPAFYGLPRAIPWLALGETQYKPPLQPNPATSFSRSMAWSTRDLAREEIRIRQTNADWLLSLLAGSSLTEASPEGEMTLPRSLSGGTSAYLRFPVLLPQNLSPRSPEGEMHRLGIERGYPKALNTLEPADSLAIDSDQEFPGASLLARGLVTLPVHRLVTEQDMVRAAAALTRFNLR